MIQTFSGQTTLIGGWNVVIKRSIIHESQKTRLQCSFFGFLGPGVRSQYSDSLQAGRYGNRTPVGGGGGGDFPKPSRSARGPNQTPTQRVPGLFSEGEVAGALNIHLIERRG
jgi:hypothetical protein